MCLGHKWLQSTWRRGEMLLALVWSHAPPFNISFWALALDVLISLCFYLLLEGGKDWKLPRMLAVACRETPLSLGLAAAQSIDRHCSCPVSMLHNQNKFSKKCLNGLKLQVLLARLKWLSRIGKPLPVSFLSFCLSPCVCAFSITQKYTIKLNFSLVKQVRNSELQTLTELHNTLKYFNSSHSFSDRKAHISLLILRVTLTGDPLSP